MLKLLLDRSSGELNTPLLLLAASGMGKSTLLAQVVKAVRLAGHYDVVHSVFVGSVERSSDALAVGRALCLALSQDLAAAHGGSALDHGQELPTDLQGICEALKGVCDAFDQKKRTVLLVIDAVNELETGRALTWLPRALPSSVRVLISTISSGGESGDASIGHENSGARSGGGAAGRGGEAEDGLSATKTSVSEVLDQNFGVAAKSQHVDSEHC